MKIYHRLFRKRTLTTFENKNKRNSTTKKPMYESHR